MNEGQKRTALIAVNLTGFMSFILDDIDIIIEMGYDVIVAADNRFGEERIRGEIARRGAEFVDIRMDTKNPLAGINWESYKAFRRMIRREKIDAIICHTPITGFIVRMAALGSGAKVIYVSHGLSWTHLSDQKTKWKFKSVESLASRFCDAIVTINDEDYDEARKLHCRNVFKINGVGCDVERYLDRGVDRHKLRESIGITDDTKILVLAIGELSSRKNQFVVARAIAAMPEKARYAYVIAGRDIAGTGIGSRMKEFCEANGVELHVLGFRDDIPQLVHCADIGVIPSVREGLGMAGIQQLAAGVPMVGTSVQGIKEYIVDGQTGFTVASPWDVAGFTEALRRLSDPTLRASMAQDCIQMAKRFGLEQSITRRREIYTQVLSHHYI